MSREKKMRQTDKMKKKTTTVKKMREKQKMKVKPNERARASW